MNFNIGPYNLTGDLRCVTVNERYTKKDNEEGFRFIGYFGTVQSALQRLSSFELKTSDAEAVEDFIREIKEHEKRMADLIASVDFDAYRKDNQPEKPVKELKFLD